MIISFNPFLGKYRPSFSDVFKNNVNRRTNEFEEGWVYLNRRLSSRFDAQPRHSIKKPTIAPPPLKIRKEFCETWFWESHSDSGYGGMLL